ncbi:PAS domain S-box-containing protein [Sphingomonas sp. F9_3S_D5_B_2]
MRDVNRPPGDGELQPTAEQLYEEAPCGYLTTWADGTIVRVNRRFLQWTGHSAEEVCGRRFSTLLTLPGRIYFETHFAPLLTMQREVREIAFDIVCRNGDRLPTLLNAALRDGIGQAGGAILITLFNGSDRRRYEEELLRARDEATKSAHALAELNRELEQRVAAEVAERLKAEEQLRQAQKMEAIGQLTGGVAHDFNNLLTVIIGSLDSMRRDLPAVTDGKVRMRLERLRDMANSGADRAASLTSRLLAFARRKPLDPRPINPNEMLKGLADLLQRTIGEQIELECVAAAGLWQALADPNELESVIVNLAVNARDAMPEGGKLTIETANVSLDDHYVEAFAEPIPPGQFAMIAVTDTGTGMDQQTLQQVFEPFFTTKEAGKGTGLGLSQVYGFARQSGGHVRIYSELGHGTTVKLYLPRSTQVAQEPAPRVPEPRVAGGDEAILVVEDHEDLRSYSVSTLREHGYSVTDAPTAQLALELLERSQEFDLLFTDVVLPGGMNGRQLAEAARQLKPTLKTLFTTGYTRNAIVHNGRLDPGVALISKPFTSDQLARKVRQVLDQH